MQQTAALSVITVPAAFWPAAMVATLTAADVFLACYIGAVIPDLADHAGHINL